MQNDCKFFINSIAIVQKHAKSPLLVDENADATSKTGGALRMITLV
jgi:hypothetical protein